jgi:hypothetical protein
MGKFIIKHIDKRKPQINKYPMSGYNSLKKENNELNEKVMTTDEKVAMAQQVMQGDAQASRIKRVKKDKGLIERTESSKTILTEDNKELLND